ncbi:MAG: hypothetical protein BGO69_05595 [Bacteroidetes bacterium 46-16]|nr:MAG: hypothetical protein BGO69_05595 [Bacteroidetes bacterium 46-16]
MSVRKDQLVTVEDLEIFKVELLSAIRQLLMDRNGGTPKKWLKSAEARKLIGFSPGKLQTVRNSGLLAFTKIGGNIYYDQDDLLRLFSEHKQKRKD